MIHKTDVFASLKGGAMMNTYGKNRMLRGLLLSVILGFSVLMAAPVYAGGMITGITVDPGNTITQGTGFSIIVNGSGVCDDLALFLNLTFLPSQYQQVEWKWYKNHPNDKSYNLSLPQKVYGGILGQTGAYRIIARPGPNAQSCTGKAEAKLTINLPLTLNPDVLKQKLKTPAKKAPQGEQGKTLQKHVLPGTIKSLDPNHK